MASEQQAQATTSLKDFFTHWAPIVLDVMRVGGHPTILALYMTLYRHRGSGGLFLWFGCEPGRTCGIAACDALASSAGPHDQSIMHWAEGERWKKIAEASMTVGKRPEQQYEH